MAHRELNSKIVGEIEKGHLDIFNEFKFPRADKLCFIEKVWPDFHTIERRKADTVITPLSFSLSLSLGLGNVRRGSTPTKGLGFPVCLRDSCLHFPSIEGSVTLRLFPTSVHSPLDRAYRNSWQLTDSPLRPTPSWSKRDKKGEENLSWKPADFHTTRNVLTICILKPDEQCLSSPSAQPCAALSVSCSKAKNSKPDFLPISYQSFAQIRTELLIHTQVHVKLYRSSWHNLSAGDIDFRSEFLKKIFFFAFIWGHVSYNYHRQGHLWDVRVTKQTFIFLF